ncbi:MAG: hypothetical protein JRI34_06690 [Deltaproteobacteria bacterium]|nr:hypothetical protein [Deltaproteobacteria bacterium]
MEDKELAKLSLLTSELLREALENHDKEKSMALSKGLAKEFVSIHKNLWSTAEDLFHYIQDVFSHAQRQTAEEIKMDIEKGNFEEALKKLERKNKQHLLLHDLYLEIIESLQGSIAQVFGEESLYKALRYTAEKKKFWFENVIKLPVEDLVKHSADLMKMHMGKCEITEDDEKFTFTMDPCGSGGRLWRKQTHGGLGKDIYLTSSAHPMNLNQEGLPAYCGHCPVWNSLLPIEWFGYPLWVYELPREAGEACKVHIYKNPEAVPAEYFQRLGKQKEKKE